MQIVIDVPEKLTCEGFERPFTEDERNILIKAIGNGVPLPKGHDRLIGAERLKEVFRRNTGHDYHDLIDAAPTIVEADKAESEEIK